MALKLDPLTTHSRNIGFDTFTSEEKARGVVSRLLTLAGALRRSPQRSIIALLAAGLLLVIIATTVVQLRLNAWNKPFYDAIAAKDVQSFIVQLGIFAIIAATLTVLNAFQTWLHETAKVRLRDWLTCDLLEQWLRDRRAVRIVWSGEISVNPDQRIHEDARHLTELTADLGVGLTQSTLLLVTFVGVLWMLSQNIALPIGGRSVVVPGYMVWCALLYAATGSWFGWLVGRPLIVLNVRRYAREAQLRAMLVRTNDHADGIALNGGEGDERRRLHVQLERVIHVMQRLAGSIARLSLVTAGYGWFALIVPLIVAAPGYFHGDLSFGALIMVVGAFNQVQQALRWFVDNYRSIADWQATLLRITLFRQALLTLDRERADVSRIEVVERPNGPLVLEDLAVLTSRGWAALQEKRLEVARGEHVLILGRSESGKSTLFRAIAGVWPWGSGRVQLPEQPAIMFLPQRPYFPAGSLRAALTYPSRQTDFDDAAMVAALRRNGLNHLAEGLDESQDWSRELPLAEQQCLSFARMLLHRPQWVVVDEGIDVLDRDDRERVLSLFKNEMAGTAVLSVGCRAPPEGFYNRIIHIAKADAPGRPAGPPERREPLEPSLVGAEPKASEQ
ncbi:MAG: glycosyl transferase family 1 [Proteobacteria bacterium]|nr:MAG: glycosyl transferase family 1 [Pseudomonadota bacterium]